MVIAHLGRRKRPDLVQQLCVQLAAEPCKVQNTKMIVWSVANRYCGTAGGVVKVVMIVIRHGPKRSAKQLLRIADRNTSDFAA